MNPEELVVVEAQDVTASVICICAVVAGIISAVFFIPRINVGSYFVQRELPIVPEVSIVAARNPFTLNILNSNVASLEDGIELKVKTSVCSQFQAFWLVDCASIQRALTQCSSTFLRDASSLHGHCLHYDQPVVPNSIDAETERQTHLMLPDTVTDTQIKDGMGPPPRSKYPLCVILRSLEECQVNSQPQIEGCVYIIHLPDGTFRDRCCLISQLIISGTGQIWDVQKLFMATETSQSDSVTGNQNTEGSSSIDTSPNPEMEERTSSGHREAETNGLPMDACVVCQNGLVSIALLPCRHTCVCTDCFPLLNKCPMCRGYIESFFSLDSDTDADWCGRLYDEDVDDDDWPARFNNACERFSQWLGFYDL